MQEESIRAAPSRLDALNRVLIHHDQSQPSTSDDSVGQLLYTHAVSSPLLLEQDSQA